MSFLRTLLSLITQDEKSSTDAPDSCLVDEPPDDPVIEEGFSLFNAQLPFWLERDPEKRILDGHLLVKKSTTEASTGWACTKDDCPFRCVVDNETSAITRSQWDHTHKSVIKYTISQAMFSAVKRRAVMDLNILPKLIYEQECKRIVDKVCGNKVLVKFIPSLTQVYQLVTKTRANPPPPPKPKAIRIKLPKQPKKKSSKSSGNNNNSTANSSGCGGTEHFDADYLLDHCGDDGERVSAYTIEHQQQNSSVYDQSSNNVLTSSFLDTDYSPISYQQPAFPHNVGNSYTNSTPPQTLQTSIFNSMERQVDFSNFSSAPNKPPQYVSNQSYLQEQQQPLQHHQQHQQQPPSLAMSTAVPHQPSSSLMTVMQQPPPQVQNTQRVGHMQQTISPDNEAVFSLNGYPLTPVMTNMNNIYWQCQVPSCRFQCVFDVGTSHLIQISGSHNHEPPSLQSTLSSQVGGCFLFLIFFIV